MDLNFLGKKENKNRPNSSLFNENEERRTISAMEKVKLRREEW